VTLGLAVSVGGMVAPLLGRLADHRGVGVVVVALRGVLLLATALAFALPSVGQISQPIAAVVDPDR
jgi:FSR family fosmidomycin resistance protein-like MFS transporter